VRIILFAAALTVSFTASAVQIVCATKTLPALDPHQVSTPLESYFSNLLYLPFFTAGNSKSVAKSWVQKDPATWQITLNNDIQFQELQGWKPKASLSASDVEFSLNRQLLRNALTVLDEQTFSPARLNGFDKNLKGIKVTGAHELELTFIKPTSLDELKSYLSRSVGSVIPREYAEFRKSVLPDFFPAYGKMKIINPSPTNLEIGPFDPKSKDEPIKFQSLRADNLHYDTIKRVNCKRLFYAPVNLVQASENKKIKASRVRVSSTQLYFLANTDFKGATTDKSRLQSGLHPDRMTSLSAYDRSNRLFETARKGLPKLSPMKSLPQPGYVMHCDYPQLGFSDLARLKNEISTGIKEAVNVETAFAAIDCKQLGGFRPASDVFGILGSFEYFSQGELQAAFSCDLATRNIFGFCLPGKPDKEAIEDRLIKDARVFPLAQLDNFLLEFY
jgi:hypothetical protein